MNQNSNNAIHLKDWMVISVKDGIVLKYEGRDQVRLIEIANDNEVRTLRLNDEVDPAFCERDTWLIAQ